MLDRQCALHVEPIKSVVQLVGGGQCERFVRSYFISSKA